MTHFLFLRLCMKITINQALSKAFKKLKKTSVSPQLDVEVMFAHALGKTREHVLAHPEIKLSRNQELKIKNYVARRAKHEPIAYITGHKEFYGLEFKVTRDTLIPRPETEMLVELAARDVEQGTWNKDKKINIIDVGTGSGNIIISLKKNLNSNCHSSVNGNPVAKLKVSTLDSRLRGNDYYSLFGLDISKRALRVAKYNAKKNKVGNKIKFIKSDLLNCFLKNNSAIKQFNNLIIVANLPYLSKKIYNTTSSDVKNFEPKLALLSKDEGLYYYEKLFKQIKIMLTNYESLVTLIIEFSPEQKVKLQKLAKKYFPKTRLKFQKDLAGKWRVCDLRIT